MLGSEETRSEEQGKKTSATERVSESGDKHGLDKQSAKCEHVKGSYQGLVFGIFGLSVTGHSEAELIFIITLEPLKHTCKAKWREKRIVDEPIMRKGSARARMRINAVRHGDLESREKSAHN